MVELLVAMAIIGMLIAIAIWGIGMAQQSARNTARREAGSQIVAQLSEYYARTNQQANCVASDPTGAIVAIGRVPSTTCNWGTVTASENVNLQVRLSGNAVTIPNYDFRNCVSACYTPSDTVDTTNITTAAVTRYVVHTSAMGTVTPAGNRICVGMEGNSTTNQNENGWADLSDPVTIACQ